MIQHTMMSFLSRCLSTRIRRFLEILDRLTDIIGGIGLLPQGPGLGDQQQIISDILRQIFGNATDDELPGIVTKIFWYLCYETNPVCFMFNN